MRFWLIDAIEEFVPGERIVTSKCVSYSEEYLQDHFPEFPVLPGVFMLEAATQAAAWLLRLSDNYQHTIIALKEARNVKYADFVSPGSKLTVTAEITKLEDREVGFKVTGEVNGSTSLNGRLVLERYCLADEDPAQAEADERLRTSLRKWSRAIVNPKLQATLSNA